MTPHFPFGRLYTSLLYLHFQFDSKPAGLTVHRSANTPRRQLVLSTLLKRQLSRKVYPVHRLDHRTSGAILFAFDSKTCSLLHQALTFSNEKEKKKSSSSDDRNLEEDHHTIVQFDGQSMIYDDDDEDSNNNKNIMEPKEHCGFIVDDATSNRPRIPSPTSSPSSTIITTPTTTVKKGSKKEYIALLRGDWKRKYGNQTEVIVDKPLKVKGITKHAKTIFRVLASSTPPPPLEPSEDNKDDADDDDETGGKSNNNNYYSPAACSLVLCIPLTGRTHQIRRHAYAMEMPIIGDSEHGDSKINRWWRENRNLNRLFLHCFHLDLPSLRSILLMEDSSHEEEVRKNDDNDEKIEEERGGVIISDENKNEESEYDDDDDKNNRIICTAPLTEDLSMVMNNSNVPSLVEMWEVARRKDPRLNLVPFDNRGGTFGRNYRKKEVHDLLE